MSFWIAGGAAFGEGWGASGVIGVGRGGGGCGEGGAGGRGEAGTMVGACPLDGDSPGGMRTMSMPEAALKINGASTGEADRGSGTKACAGQAPSAVTAATATTREERQLTARLLM